jgi:hypothetical protein
MMKSESDVIAPISFAPLPGTESCLFNLKDVFLCFVADNAGDDVELMS